MDTSGLHAWTEADGTLAREHLGMDERCLQCDHPKVGHYGTGCHRTSFLRGDCDCDFVEPAPLPPSATAEQHLERAAWWSRRIDLTDRRMWHATHGSDQWLRLDRLREVAKLARRQHLEMARESDDMLRQPDDTLRQPDDTLRQPDGALREPDDTLDDDQAPGTAIDAPGGDLLELLSLEAMERQPASTLGLLPTLFDHAPLEAQDAVRARLEDEFDALDPRRRRVLLEDAALRTVLAHLGVVTPWKPPEGSPVADPDDVEVPHAPDALELVMGRVLRGPRLADELARAYAGSMGDEHWAQTHGEAGAPPPVEGALPRYRHTREQLEAYWRHWAVAPDPALQRSLITQHPDAFRRQMSLAIGVMTPPEKARFERRWHLFGWVASGMLPLFEDGDPVPLEDVVEARYLALADR